MRLLEYHVGAWISSLALLRLPDLSHLLTHEGGRFDLEQVSLFRVHTLELLQKGQVLVEVCREVEIISCITIFTIVIILHLCFGLVVRHTCHFYAPKTIRVSRLDLESFTSGRVWISGETIN